MINEFLTAFILVTASANHTEVPGISKGFVTYKECETYRLSLKNPSKYACVPISQD